MANVGKCTIHGSYKMFITLTHPNHILAPSISNKAINRNCIVGLRKPASGDWSRHHSCRHFFHPQCQTVISRSFSDIKDPFRNSPSSKPNRTNYKCTILNKNVNILPSQPSAVAAQWWRLRWHHQGTEIDQTGNRLGGWQGQCSKDGT